MSETTIESPHKRHFPVFLLVAYLMFWAFFAYQPVDRFDWILENVLVLIFVIFLVWSYKYFRLSNISYGVIFVYMLLHTLGAHYTYSEVPLGYWLSELFGATRNHFDRIVHFSFGLLLAYPIREVFHRIASAKGFWGYWLPLELTLAFSAIYEIMEWATAVAFGAGASAFLGTQGDEFDAIKDMALAGLGALITMIITASVNWHLSRKEFVKEMEESIEIKDEEPMGEVAIEKMEKKNALAEKFRAYKEKSKKAVTEPLEEETQAEEESDEPITDDNIGSDIDKHNHSPEEIMRLLQGENIHAKKRSGKAKTKKPAKNKASKKKK